MEIYETEKLPAKVSLGEGQERIEPPRTWAAPSHWLELIRHPWYRGLVEIQDRLHFAINDFFRKEGLRVLDLPLTTGSISSPMGLGSDSLPVAVDICDSRTYLADSMQFLLELGCRLHPEGVYYKSVSFRGEKTDRLHLAQFHHAECEIPGALENVMDVASRFVYELTSALHEDCAATVEQLAGTLSHVESCLDRNGRFPTITNAEAVKLLSAEDSRLVESSSVGFEVPSKLGEKRLAELLGGGVGVWLTHLPSLAVPFYQAIDPSDPQQTLTADLILGTCETVGSGQRHQTSDGVLAALARQGVASEPYEWYWRMRQEAALETSGFGMGIERYLMWVLRQQDIRDCVLLLRRNGHSGNP